MKNPFYLTKEVSYSGDALALASALAAEPNWFLLNSSLQNPVYGRYSIMGFDPFFIFKEKGAQALDHLKKSFYEYYEPGISELPFTSGIVGFLSYDFGLYAEKTRKQSKEDLGLPDIFFGFYDVVVTLDHAQQKLFITSTGLPEKDDSRRKLRAQSRLENAQQKLKQAASAGAVSGFGELKSNFTREGYFSAFKKVMEHIEIGDIYQVNLAQRFESQADGKINTWVLYQQLQHSSPTAFGAFLKSDTFDILSTSPELFLKLKGGRLETRPMKGTRRRGRDQKEDVFLKEDLMNSPKDRAELLMITDLERNDLGKVCEYGSVKVREMRSLEIYNPVFQTTATIDGVLRKDQDCFDALKACFPSGSVTGCPKIRSMEIIEELEPHSRGVYTGSLGFIGFNGDMEFNILIRSLLAVKDKIYFHVGSGIVADSKAEAEYEETFIKAQAIKDVLKNETIAHLSR